MERTRNGKRSPGNESRGDRVGGGGGGTRGEGKGWLEKLRGWVGGERLHFATAVYLGQHYS